MYVYAHVYVRTVPLDVGLVPLPCCQVVRRPRPDTVTFTVRRAIRRRLLRACKEREETKKKRKRNGMCVQNSMLKVEAVSKLEAVSARLEHVVCSARCTFQHCSQVQVPCTHPQSDRLASQTPRGSLSYDQPLRCLVVKVVSGQCFSPGGGSART